MVTLLPPDFNPLPPCGGRRWVARSKFFFGGISIHSLRVEGDVVCYVALPVQGHFNPLPPCGGRRPVFDCFTVVTRISIHSLRVEGDKGFGFFDATSDISIHSLRVEGDDANSNTLIVCSNISIHSLRVEGDQTRAKATAVNYAFQSTPSVWRETCPAAARRRGREFQSTPSVWRETSQHGLHRIMA